jgi:hypothetical protein
MGEIVARQVVERQLPGERNGGARIAGSGRAWIGSQQYRSSRPPVQRLLVGGE